MEGILNITVCTNYEAHREGRGWVGREIIPKVTDQPEKYKSFHNKSYAVCE